MNITREHQPFTAKILGDFQSKVLKEEWEKHQKYMIAKGNQRRLQEYQKKEQLDQQVEQFRAQDSARQSQLDQRMDDLQAKFSDSATAFKFDAQRLDQTLASISVKEEMEAPCLGPRTNVTVCLSSESKRDCSDFVLALEKCVGEKVAEMK